MITKTREHNGYQGGDSAHPSYEVYDFFQQPEPAHPYPSAIDETDPGASWPGPGQLYSCSGGNESIEYSNRGLHNTCYHTDSHLWVSENAYEGYWRSASGPWNSEDWRFYVRVHSPASLLSVPQRGIAGPYEFGAVPELTVPWASTWEADLSSQALRVMWPGIHGPSGLSLVNSILELKDFKSLYRSAQALRRRLVRIPQIAKAYGRPTNRKALIGLLKRLESKLDPLTIAAESNLSYQFAIRPFVSDVIGLYRSIRTVESEIRRLQSQAGKELTSHYQHSFVVPDVLEYRTRTDPGLWPFNYYTKTRVTKNTVAEYHATMVYNFSLPDNGAIGKLAALGDMLGVNLDASIAWNAIPWTFAVDWVCKVGDFLSQFKSKNVRPIMNILSFCHSVKYERTTELRLQQNVWDTTAPQPDMTVARETKRVYIRKPYAPSYYSTLQWSGISLREFTLSVSLARVRKRRRR